jgi:hypothetical protein
MKATMSSFSDSKLSVLIVKESFSQMQAGWAGANVKSLFRGREGKLEAGGMPFAAIQAPRLCLP